MGVKGTQVLMILGTRTLRELVALGHISFTLSNGRLGGHLSIVTVSPRHSNCFNRVGFLPPLHAELPTIQSAIGSPLGSDPTASLIVAT